MFHRTRRIRFTQWRHKNVLISQMDLNLQARMILPCKLQSNTREREKKINSSVFGSKLQLEKEVNCPSVSVKLVFFLWLFCFVFFFFLLCFIACFSAKFASKILAKSVVFYANLSLQITRNLPFFPVIRSLHLCTVMHSALKCNHKWLNKT